MHAFILSLHDILLLDASLQIQCAAREEILYLRFGLDQSLFIGKIDQGLEHLAIPLYAVRVRIAAEDLLRHFQILLTEEQA